MGLLLTLVPAVCALDLRVTGAVGSEASNVVNGEELGLQFDTLHNALVAANSGDTVLVQPGQWAGVQDATLLYRKTLYIRSTGGALVTALRGSNGAPDEERVAALTQCALRTMPSMPFPGQDACGVQDGSRLSLQDDVNADPAILASGARLRELFGGSQLSEMGLNLRANAGVDQISVEVEGFTFHNFGFSGVRYATGDSDFSDIWGAPNGGVFNLKYAQLTLRKSIAHSNIARRGGVVYMELSVLDLDTVIFRDNKAREQGGAIYSMITRNVPGAWDVMASRTIFQGNKAGAEGGGLFADETYVRLDNAIFTDNEAGVAREWHVESWPWQTGTVAFTGSTIEQRTQCCNGLPACQCGGGGMVLRGKTHHFDSVVSEDNTCTSINSANCNSDCQSSPVIGPATNPDGACFCLDSCTSSTDPITLDNSVDSHTLAVGLGRFYDTPSTDEFYFGGNGKTFTLTYPKPLHTIRVAVRNFELPAYEERLIVLDEAWDAACACHEACAEGDTVCHDSCTAAHAPNGRCSRLAVMSGTSGFSVTSSRRNTGTSVSFRVSQDPVPQVSCVSKNEQTCASVNTNQLDCDNAAGGAGACTWTVVDGVFVCVAPDTANCAAESENGAEACESAGNCVYTAPAPGSPWYTRGGFEIEVTAITCNEAEPQCVPTHSDRCSSVITTKADCLGAGGGGMCTWENDACVAAAVTNFGGPFGARCTGVSLAGLSVSEGTRACQDQSGAPCTFVPGARVGCSNHGSCHDYRAREPRDGAGARISWTYYCVCDDGFTGNDCSHQIVSVTSALRGMTTDYVNLQTAIDAAPDGDTLTVTAPTRLYGAGNAGLIFPAKSLKLRGVGPLSTAIDCTGSDRAMSIQHAEGSLTVASAAGFCPGCARKMITVSSLSVRNCVAHPDGGVIPAGFSWPYYTRQAVSRSGKGAAIFIETPADVSLVNLVVENNRAQPAGGAVYLSKLVNPGVIEDVLLHNTALGGGLVLADVRAQLDRTFLSNNVPVGVSITSVTAAGPAVVTLGTASPIAEGSKVTIVDIVGDMGTERLNGNSYWVSVRAGVPGSSVTRIALFSDPAMSIGVDTSFMTYSSGGVVRHSLGSADKNLMCLGTVCPYSTADDCAGTVVAEYHGALQNDETEQFNCHCWTDCERALGPALTLNTATLVSGNRVVIHGERLAIGADSQATSITLSDTGGSWKMQCTDPMFVRPEMIICELHMPTPFVGELQGARLRVARSDGSAAQQPMYAECGIEAIIDGDPVTTENAGSVTFRIRLKSQPLHPVSVPISMGLDSENVPVGQPSVSMVWFSTTDWDQWQSVVVKGLEDGLVRGTVAYQVALGPTASLDHVYGGNAGAESASFPLSQHSSVLQLENHAFSCPRISERLASDSMTCECAPGFTRVSDGSGVYQCTECPSGYYKTAQGNHACSVCPGDIAQSVGTRDHSTGNYLVSACVCRPGYYAEPETSGATLRCVECPLGTACGTWGYQLAEVGVLPGFWRADATSPYVIRCSTPEHCNGAANMSSDAMCRPGTYGHQCYGCEAGYGRNGNLCEQCDDQNWKAATGAWLPPVFLVPYALLALTRPPPVTQTMMTWYKVLPMTKVLISFLQMRLVMNTLYDHWSTPLRTLFNGMGAFSSAAFIDIPSVDCAFASSSSAQRYYSKVYLSLLMPIAFISPIFLWYRASVFLRNPFKWNKPHPNAPGVFEWKQQNTRMRRWFVSCALGAAFVTIPAAVRIAVGALVCDSNEVSGKAYLRVDISIPCDDPSLTAMTTSAWAALMFYTFVLPAGMLIALYKQRHNLSNTAIKKTYAFLFSGYRADYMYWEVVVLVRTMAIMVVSSSASSPVARTGGVLLVVQFGLLIHMNRSPHDADSVLAARLETLSLTSTSLSMLLSLVQMAISDVEPHMLIEVLQWLINLAYIVLCIAVIFGQVWEETGDPTRVPLKRNAPGNWLLSPAWYHGSFGTSAKVAVQQDDYQASMLQRAMQLRETNEAKAKIARASAKLTIGRAMGDALETTREDAASGEKRPTPVAEKQMSQSEEMVYLAKEKELHTQIEQMRLQLEKVQRREKLTNSVNLLARGTGKSGGNVPVKKPTSLTALRRTMDAHGGIQLGEGAFADVGQAVEVGVQTIDTGITGGEEGPGAAALFEAQTCELEATLDLGEISATEARRLVCSEDEMVRYCAQFAAEVSSLLAIPLRRVRVLHARVGPPVHGSQQEADSALVVRWQLFPSLRTSDPLPSQLAEEIRLLYTDIGGELYDGEILQFLSDLRLVDGPDGTDSHARAQRPGEGEAEYIVDAIPTEVEHSDEHVPTSNGATSDVKQSHDARTDVQSVHAPEREPEPKAEPDPDPKPEPEPEPTVPVPMPPSTRRPPHLPSAIHMITPNRMVYTSSAVGGPPPYTAAASTDADAAGGEGNKQQTLGTSTFEKMFAQVSSKSPDDSSDDDDPLVRVAADDGTEMRDTVSDTVVQAIHGRGGRESEVKAMHFLAARDAITGNQEQMRHLRSAINAVRKGHKHWWRGTDDDVETFARAEKGSKVAAEASVAFQTGALPAALARSSLESAASVEEVSPASPVG